MARNKSNKKAAGTEATSIQHQDDEKPTYEFGVPAKEIPTFYINNAHFSVSDMDMKIDLCEIQSAEVKDGIKTISVMPKARIFMAWPFAVRFLGVMKQQLDNHQKVMAEMLAEFKQKQAEQKSKE